MDGDRSRFGGFSTSRLVLGAVAIEGSAMFTSSDIVVCLFGVVASWSSLGKDLAALIIVSLVTLISKSFATSIIFRVLRYASLCSFWSVWTRVSARPASAFIFSTFTHRYLVLAEENHLLDVDVTIFILGSSFATT